jgi:methylmalonyl-CoA/ethylmalonyl-CoA epimerase
MAAWKLGESVEFFRELFGMKVAGRFDNPEDGYNGVVLDMPGGAQWEILEPAGENSFVTRFLNERGPGLHHVTFEVESIEAAAAVLRQKGIEPFGVRAAGSWKELFIHPRDTGGVLVQLYEPAGRR